MASAVSPSSVKLSGLVLVICQALSHWTCPCYQILSNALSLDVSPLSNFLPGRVPSLRCSLPGRVSSLRRSLSGRVPSVPAPVSGRVPSVPAPVSGRVPSVPAPVSGRVPSVPAPVSGRVPSVPAPVYTEQCHCPQPSFPRWLSTMECPTDGYPQITKDLAPFPRINMSEVASDAVARFNKRGSHSLCHYVVKDNKVGISPGMWSPAAGTQGQNQGAAGPISALWKWDQDENHHRAQLHICTQFGPNPPGSLGAGSHRTAERQTDRQTDRQTAG